MSRSLTAIRHVPFEGLESFESLLRNADFTITYRDAPTDDLTEIDPDCDLLVLMGGPVSAYQERAYPFLREELRLLERRLETRRPTLGICLGAQLLARALGARVYQGDVKQIGWGRIALTAAGRSSSLTHLDGEHTPVLHWHGDTFDLPNGATLLASDDTYAHQAFSVGNCLGLQFHPEATARGLETWYVSHAAELEQTNISLEHFRIESRQYAPVLQSYAELFLHGWLRSVGL